VKVQLVIVADLDLDDLAAGDPQTEAVADIARAIGEAIRHRTVAAGVRVGAVSSLLRTPKPTEPTPCPQ